MLNFITDIKLRNKLVLAFIIITLIPILLITVFAVKSTSNQIERGLERRVKNSLDVAVNAYNEIIQKAEKQAIQIAQIEEVQNALIRNRKLRLIQFVEIKRPQLELFFLGIADSTGKIVAKSFETDSTSHIVRQKKDDYRDYIIKSNDKIILYGLERSADIFVEKVKDEIVIKGVAPIRTYRDAFGVVLIEYILNNKFISQIDSITNNRITLYLEEEPITSSFPADSIVGYKYLIPSYDVVENVIYNGEKYLSIQNIKGVPYSVGYAPIFAKTINDSNEIKKAIGMISVAVPRDEIESIKRRSNIVLTISGTVALLLAIIVGVIIARQITIPITKLVNGTTEIARGHLGKQVNITSKDEIGNLARTFNQMSIALKEAYDSIERLFDGFVKASVTAIESRDPTTSGHSNRVAILTVGLAEALNKINGSNGNKKLLPTKLDDNIDNNQNTTDAIEEYNGRYKGIVFSPSELKELRFASLLHDFGKVGVRENVLVKEKKLYPMHLEVIKARFKFAMESLKNLYAKKKLDIIKSNCDESFDESVIQQIDNELNSKLQKLEDYLKVVISANEPTVLSEGNFEILQEIAKQTYIDEDGNERPLLEESEVRLLSIKKGTLDDKERQEIESHVTHTFKFLSEIPWTKELLRIPEIAYAHHEKLSGKGYPRRITEEKITLQSKMMAIADIFDALTASDRPYKKAMPVQKALDIIKMEAKDNALDSELVDIFIKYEVYKLLEKK